MGTATQLAWTTPPAHVTNGLVFGTSPVLKTTDASGNPSTVGLPANKFIQIALYSGSGALSGTLITNIGTAGANGVATFTNLSISVAGPAQLVAFDIGAGNLPTNISAGANCQLWLDAADMTTMTVNGSTLSVWKDKSGHNNNATGGVSPMVATDSLLAQTSSGLSQVVRFNGANTYLGMNLSSLRGSPYTIIAIEVATQKNNDSSYFIGNTGGDSTDLTLHIGYNSPTEWRWGQYGDDLNYDTNFTFPAIRTSTERITSSRAETFFINSAQVGSRTAQGLLTGTALGEGTLGSALGGAYYMGDLAEIMVFNTALSDADRQTMETYLSTKWSNGYSSAVTGNFTVLLTNGLVPLSQVVGIYRQLWTNLNANIGSSLSVLTNTSLNPFWPNNPTAAFTKVFTNFETEVNTGMNNYGERLRTFVIPPTNGNYTFWIASDDTSQLFLSTDETATNKVLIAQNTGYTDSRQWTKYPSQVSTPIALRAGYRYYLEAIMQQGGGGDNLAVRWQLPNGQIEEPLSATSTAGTILIPCTGVDTAPAIYSQTGNVTALERTSFNLSVLMANQSALTYQWRLGNANIVGAKGPIFSITNASIATNNGQVYTCVISNSAGVITNLPITLNIIRDTNPPVVTLAQNLGLNQMAISFSKPLDPVSSTRTANYVFTNGLAVIGASLDSTATIVTLSTAAMTYGSNYSIVINSVKDLDATPNIIATNTTVSFVAEPYSLMDIGGSGTPSTTTYVTNGVDVTAAGSDIGGSTDQFNLEYQLRTGNFDVQTRVAGFTLADIWAKAGLMARETLAPGARFAGTFTTPSINGDFFEWRDPLNSTANTTGSFPANYPNTWLRLKRLGNVFSGYGSYDGQTWTQLGSVTIAMSNQIYLGFSLSSHGTNVNTAQFLNESDVVNAVVGTVVNPHEGIGPSSRKSPIAFSEIMYKPAARADGRNLEFIEIYNSNPYFQDISGYQITCADMNYTFPPNTVLAGGAYLVVAAAPVDLTSVYGITNVMGPYLGSLKKTETLELIDEHAAVLLTVPYSTTYPWPTAADGTGHSIVLANASYGEGDPRAWDISDIMGGSPGANEAFRPSPLRNVVINEILPHTEQPGVPQFVELYNHSSNSVDISGCILTDDPATNKFVIPASTILPPAGFVSFTQSQFGFPLNGGGASLYFIKPDGSRILDSVEYGAQADGVSYGRWPDGANDFYNFISRTPGTNNSSILIGDIVINELMYDPITENDDDQYVELYNKGTNNINLGGWQFISGITYTFPANTILSAGGYLTVSRNTTNLFAKYPSLSPANTVGNFSGKLSHNGELIALAMPQTLNGTTNILVIEDQVTYGTGGRWGQWSGGGGSSLELIDPRANHRLAANWADSDDTAKSVWTDIETTGVLDDGQNYGTAIDYAQIGILDSGECLVDNIEVDFNGANYVTNSDFETGGTNGWSFQGCFTRSSLENTGYNSAHSLHLRSSDHVWTGDNSCQVALNNLSLQSGQTVTLRFKAKWLHGWPEALLRLHGNWLEAAGTMTVPPNLGTPGQPNSRYVTNAGPAIYSVTHTPTLPAASQPVVVTASVHDPDGLVAMTLFYRLDPATSYTPVAMKDNGTGGDAVAGDGIYSATIPGQNSGQLVAFYISATDTKVASTRFPPLISDNAPVREGLILFGDSDAPGSFSTYHLWISSTNVTRWANLSDLSNEEMDGTFVYGKRVVYNMAGRFAGSPYHQDFDTPVGGLCHYKWSFPDDDQFLGTTDFNKIHQPGNFAGDDASLQREQLANFFLRALGVPWLNRRYIVVNVNGNRRGTLMEDAQCPGGDVVKEHYPNDSDGYLYKMQPWFEFAPFPTGSSIGFNNQSWCNIESYLTTGNAKKIARYRYMFLSRRTPDSESNFTNVFNLIDAANSSSSPNYVANLEGQADMENWMRVFAANHAAGNWDSFGSSSGQNLYGYVGTQGTKYSLHMWDFNLVFGDSGSWNPGENLFTFNGEDPNIQTIFSNPTFQRMYWRALGELVNGPMDLSVSGPMLLAKYNVFVANGLSVEDPRTALEGFVSTAQSSIANQLASVNATAFSVTTPVVTSNNIAYVSGIAPVDVSDIWINGVEYPVNWTSLTGWTIPIPLTAGNNTLNITGVDHNGQPIAGDTNTVNVNFSGTTVSPVGHIFINEVMAQPSVSGGQYVELYNNSTNVAFDLSGWQLQGLNYTFPTGSLIGATNFVVLAANRDVFANTYGASIPVLDTFTTALLPGQTLSLIQPGIGSNIVVAELRYDNRLPWPTNAVGASLQLIDAKQDNWRVANWAVKTSGSVATPGAINSVAAVLPIFQTLWLNEIEPGNLAGITNSAGQRTAWIELYNPTTNTLSLSGLYLANTYTNLFQSALPTTGVIKPGEFKIIFADGLTNLSTTNEPHTSFVLSNSTGSLALSRNIGGQAQVLDYLDYTNVPVNDSYGSSPDGQSFVRQLFFNPTPRSANADALPPAPSAVSYAVPGSIYSQDFNALPNPGATSVNSANPVTVNGVTYSLANPFDFAFPVTATGGGGLGLQTMAGWYGLADPTASVGTRLGATDGDQTTGGQNSFGSPNSNNRALGLLATSTTGYTAFGLKLVNDTGETLKYVNLQYTGELWRQSDTPKTVEFYYYLDPTAAAAFSTNTTGFIPAMNVVFPTLPADKGGDPVIGTDAANQTNLAFTNQFITWPANAALWLVWEMPDSSGKAQGMGIDNLSFSATAAPVAPPPGLNFSIQSGNKMVLSFPTLIGPTYQIESSTNLGSGVWTPVGASFTGIGGSVQQTNLIQSLDQTYYRLKMIP
ncbi:MAG TPA: lamin tail domain-containing protein [Verrucomicrobiae bacterium]|nr:lamin tail domain-containing protein [Verrucomicrobiae bacterium]